MSAPTPSFLLVDGNNYIHSTPELLARYRQRPSAAHRELIGQLETLRDFSDFRVVCVFDGRGNTINQEREPGSVQVFYSSSNSSADSIIERLAVNYAEQYQITVATDDRPIQNAVIAAGGEALSTYCLQGLIDNSLLEMRRVLNSHRRK